MLRVPDDRGQFIGRSPAGRRMDTDVDRDFISVGARR